MTPRLPYGFAYLRFLIVAILLGGMLAGCSSNDDEGDPTATAVPPDSDINCRCRCLDRAAQPSSPGRVN